MVSLFRVWGDEVDIDLTGKFKAVFPHSQLSPQVLENAHGCRDVLRKYVWN